MVYSETEVIKETLLEKCLYDHIAKRDGENINYNDWFNYMITMRQEIDTHSNIPVELEDGTTTLKTYEFATTPQVILKNLGYSRSEIKSINDCVDESYMSVGDTTSDNQILKDDRQWQYLMRVNSYPAITINNQTYTGDFDGHDIAVALCASFQSRPKICAD